MLTVRPCPASSLIDRKHARDFHARVDSGGAGARRLATDVDDGRTVGGQREAVFDGAITVEEQPSVGEGVVGDVHDAHDPHVVKGSLSQDEIQRLGP